MSQRNKLFFWVPNAITSLNLLSGSIAIFLAVDGQLGWAAVFILLAALFDFLDGLSARLLHAYSTLGKELDSLADVISFGLAPATIIFTLLELSLFGKNQSINSISANWSQWTVLLTSLVIPVAGAFRLAKFNTDARQSEHFLGMPIPASALFLSSFGLIQEWGTNTTIASIILNKHVLLAAIFFCSFLMVSELPMFSVKFKSLNFRQNTIQYTFISTALLMILFLQLYALPVIILWYVLLSAVSYYISKN
jgi:CDP-diacylglycerol--serine O-phosphatidyltransferase